MPISVACPCGKKLTVKDELAGKRVRCPGCQAVVSVPAAGKAPPAAAPAKPKPAAASPNGAAASHPAAARAAARPAAAAKPAAPPARAAAPPPPALEEEQEQEQDEEAAANPAHTPPPHDEADDDELAQKPHDDDDDEQQEGDEDERAEEDEQPRPKKKHAAEEEEQEDHAGDEDYEADQDDEPVRGKKSEAETDTTQEDGDEDAEEERPRGKKAASKKKPLKPEEEEEEEEEEAPPKKAAKAKGKGKGKKETLLPMLHFNKYIVKAKARGGKKTFEIQDAESGDVIATAKNATSFLASLVGSVVYAVTDSTTDEKAFTVGRSGWPIKKDQIVDGKGRVVGRFKTRFLSLSGGYNIYGADGEHVCEIKGKLFKSEYRFLSPSGDEMGSVSKTWGGAFKSMLTGAGTYGVQVEDEYAHDSRVKMIMLAATIAVETIFQAPKSGKKDSSGEEGGDDE